MNNDAVQTLAHLAGLSLSKERIEYLAPLLSEQLEALKQLRPMNILEEPVSLFEVQKIK
jgi:Asp-tRNA(Asn)/Glu-tRNA(Gln) amidotransferase C subunit